MALLPEPGVLFAGKYVIESQLGGGAAGVVFSAMHQELRERVAVKVLRDAGPVATERMVREARNALALHSEHVVRVMDVGRDEGRVYLVMEQLDGVDLGTLLKRRGALPVAEAVDYVLQACAGVAEAHARGIVHRDLKPSNLFLTKRADGSPLVKVLDFGISKSQGGGDGDVEASLTGPAEVLGSPMYMSPEQVRGAKAVDHRTDLWALGVIVFRLVTGKGPFGAGKTVSAALASVVADEPESLRGLLPDVPRELDAVVRRCLAKNPAERFASVTELAAALAPIGTDDGRMAVARLLRDHAGPASRPKRRSWRWLLVASAAGIVGVGVAGALEASRGAGTSAAASATGASVIESAGASATAAAAVIPSSAPAASAPPGSSASRVSAASGAAPVPTTGSSPVVRRPVVRPRVPANSSVVRSAATDDRY